MSLKRNFKVRVRDYKLAPSVENTASFCAQNFDCTVKNFALLALQLRTSATQRVKLCCGYTTNDAAPFCKRSCSEIRLWVLVHGIEICMVRSAWDYTAQILRPHLHRQKFYRTELRSRNFAAAQNCLTRILSLREISHRLAFKKRKI